MATGGYQIFHATLNRLIKTYNINHNVFFNAKTQNHLAKLLISECDKQPARIDRLTQTTFANCLAAFCAALPLKNARHQGRSAFASVAENKALTIPNIILALLAGHQLPTTSQATPTHKEKTTTQSTQQPKEPKTFAFGTIHVVNAHSRDAYCSKKQRSHTISPSLNI